MAQQYLSLFARHVRQATTKGPDILSWHDNEKFESDERYVMQRFKAGAICQFEGDEIFQRTPARWRINPHECRLVSDRPFRECTV